MTRSNWTRPIAALVLLSLELTRSTAQALLYLAAFGIGSVAGMAALSLAISLREILSSERDCAL